MSQPPFPYNRIFDFESFSIVNPTTQQPGVQIEGELDGVKRTLDSLISRLSEIQRDDGYIRDSALDQSTAIPQFYDRLVLLFNPTFTQIDQKINLKSNIASPTFTGVVTIPANAVIVGFAKLESPDFTGVPTAPTPATLSVSQQVANAAFVTAADNAVKQFVADNFLSLGGDRMNDNSVINWTGVIPATQYPAYYSNTITNDISKDGVSLFGKYPHPFSAALYSATNRRETVVSQGSIELREFTTPGVYPVGTPDTNAPWTLKGEIVIWSGDSYDAFTEPLPVIAPLTGPHITLWDKANTYGIKPMMISSNGLQFPDGSNQDTRGLSIGEVLTVAIQQSAIAVEDLINGAPGALDTLKEIADALGNDTDLAGTLTTAIAGKANAVHTHVFADVAGLQGAIDASKIVAYDNFKIYGTGDLMLHDNRIFRFNSFVGAAGYGPTTHPSYWTEQSAAPNLTGYATTAALTSGLAGKANSTHSHSIANVTGLQAELNLKSSTSHTHDISGLTGLTNYFYPYQKRTLPVVYANYAQEFSVSSSGSLHILDYATDGNGKVNFNSGAIGDRFFFYQSANAAYPIQLVGAINIDNKTFTRGAKSYVEAVSTPDGIVVSGDLMFPPSGTLLSSSCDYVENLTDASGSQTWSGNFYSNNLYADGSGGTYSTGGYNQDGCWYPMGFVISYGVTLSESTLSWSGCSNSGTYTYSQGAGNIIADGAGGTTQQYTGGWSANQGDVIYDSMNSCVVKYDGMGGYYVEDTSGNSGGYGTYLGNFGGTSQFTYYDSSSNTYEFDSYYWSEDRYDDGMGSYYTANYSSSYVSYGTYLGYNSTDGISLYADGNGSYYTS